jgi:hypothetical protein
MTETVDLAALDEASFERLYRERIEPLFRAREADRLRAVGHFKQRVAIGAPLSALAGLGIGVGFKEPMGGVFAALIGGLFTYTIANGPLIRLRKGVKEVSLAVLAEAMGCAYDREPLTLADMTRMLGLRLLPSYDRAGFDDHFHGERHGCSFELHEAHLEDERRDKDGDTDWVTVFRGQIIKIAFPKKFAGVTIVRRDAGVFNGMQGWGSNLQRIGIGEGRFERAFEVFGSDQVEARYLLHPVFLERLLELEQAFKGKQIRCAFEAGDLLIAVEGGDKFEIGDLFKPLTDPSRARALVNDIAQILKLIDAVLTAEQAPLERRGEN